MNHKASNKGLNRKTIFLVIYQGFAARYLLRSDILKELKKHFERIVIISPNADEAYFKKEFIDENVSIEKLEIEKYKEYLKKSKGQSFFKKVRWFVLNGKYQFKSVDDHYKLFLEENNTGDIKSRLIIFFIDKLVMTLRRSKMLRRFFLWIECKLFNPAIHYDLFEKYNPDLIITTSLGNVGEGFDLFIMREAKKYGIRILTIILSWDNTSGKGMGGAVPDYIITWTDIMKKELIEYHDYPAHKIFVGGVSHFDIYYQKDKLLNWGELCSRFGFSPHRKLLFFGTKSPTACSWNMDIVDIIAKSINEKRLLFDCQLVVRIHPLYYTIKNGVRRHANALEEIEKINGKYPHVYFNYPCILSDSLGFDMPADEMIILASLLKHSSVVINSFSTIALESCICDIPTINVAFEGYGVKERTKLRHNINYERNWDHFQRLMNYGAIRNVLNEEDLIKKINVYLENPMLDREKRQKVVEYECGPFNGFAGSTIGDYIIKLVEK